MTMTVGKVVLFGLAALGMLWILATIFFVGVFTGMDGEFTNAAMQRQTIVRAVQAATDPHVRFDSASNIASMSL
jgi:hypothetical protein